MSYRKEKKFRLSQYDMSKVMSSLRNLGMKNLHPKRTINSIYYDSDDFVLYKDSVEGLAKRIKYRLRYYNDEVKKIRLEKKIRINEYGSKELSEGLDQNPISIEIFDPFTNNKNNISVPRLIINTYKPILITKYSRIYLSFASDRSSRITLDTLIRFGSLCATGSGVYTSIINTPFDRSVMEIKFDCSNEHFAGMILKEIDSIALCNERNSKYSNAVDSLF